MEALSDVHKESFFRVEGKEVKDLEARKTWGDFEQEKCFKNYRVIHITWHFKIEINSGEMFYYFKEILCVIGGLQRKIIEYVDTYSLIVQYSKVSMMLTLTKK